MSVRGAATGAASGAAAGSVFGPWGTGIGAGLGFLGGLFDRGNSAVVPKDIAGLREQQIALLNALLKPGAFDAGGFGDTMFFGGANNPTSNFLAQPSPEMRTYDTARPVLEGMLTGTGPQFEQDIARANSTGGRFSSGNAVMRGEALRNLFNARTQTAQTLGVLAGQAGSSQWDRINSQQNAHLQLLAGILGMSGQATLGLPVTEGDQANGGIGDILKAALAYAQIRGGGGGNGAGGGGGTFRSMPDPRALGPDSELLAHFFASMNSGGAKNSSSYVRGPALMAWQ